MFQVIFVISVMAWHHIKNDTVKSPKLLDEIAKNILAYLGTSDDLAYVTNRDEKYPQQLNKEMTLVGYEHVKMGTCNGPACILNEGRKPVKAGVNCGTCVGMCVCVRVRACVHGGCVCAFVHVCVCACVCV